MLSDLTIILSNFVAVEMISHRNPPFPFESINVGILLSATEICGGIPGAVNSKITPKFTLLYSFCRHLFSQLLSSLILLISNPYFFDKPFYQHWY